MIEDQLSRSHRSQVSESDAKLIMKQYDRWFWKSVAEDIAPEVSGLKQNTLKKQIQSLNARTKLFKTSGLDYLFVEIQFGEALMKELSVKKALLRGRGFNTLGAGPDAGE